MATDGPNVLLLLSDQHNHRYLGSRDPTDAPVRTPTLDGLAADGTTFERAYTPVPAGTPARLCTLTGRRASECGAWDRDSRLRADLTTLPDPFREAGYRTCLVGTLGFGGDRQFAGFGDRPYGDHTGTGGHQFDPITTALSRGSPGAAGRDATGGLYGDQYDPIDPERRHPDPWRGLTDDAGPTTIPESRLQERIVTQESLAWLRDHERADGEQPWLLCASFNRPHYPLTAPKRHFDRHWPTGGSLPSIRAEDALDHPLVDAKAEADRTSELHGRQRACLDDEQIRRSRAAYAASVDFLDEVLGDFLGSLDRAGFLENTVVVYASTQGQLLGEHGLWWTRSFHEPAVRVPWIVRTPAHRDGDRDASRIDEPVSLLDLYPTLCGLCDVEAAGDVDGRDLSAAVQTGSEPDRGPVSVDHLVPEWGEGTEFRAVRDGRYKYVRFRDAPDLLFDLSTESEERQTHDDERVSERLRDRIDEELDFDAVAAERERAYTERESYRLPASTGTAGNSYLLGDGRVADADTMLYKTDELVHDAERLFADWPDEQ